jgi:hypothetical protein
MGGCCCCSPAASVDVGDAAAALKSVFIGITGGNKHGGKRGEAARVPSHGGNG